MSRRVWRTTDGREIPYELLLTEHLINILNWMERTPHWSMSPNFTQRQDEYFYLRTEAMKRGVRWRNYAGQPPLQDGELDPPPATNRWDGVSSYGQFSGPSRDFSRMPPLREWLVGHAMRRLIGKNVRIRLISHHSKRDLWMRGEVVSIELLDD
jgi:hypothetical protein